MSSFSPQPLNPEAYREHKACVDSCAGDLLLLVYIKQDPVLDSIRHGKEEEEVGGRKNPKDVQRHHHPLSCRSKQIHTEQILLNSGLKCNESAFSTNGETSIESQD